MTGAVYIILAALAVNARPENVGKRPYEMVRAGRTTDDVPPLVDFEDLAGWRVEVAGARASFSRSREQQIWGRHVGKLLYRGDGKSRRPRVTIRPPRPIPLPKAFDCVRVWVCGNNWAWRPDPTTPRVQIDVLMRPAGGGELAVPLGQVRWKEWWLMHRKLSAEQRAAVAKGASFTGIRITRGTNEADRLLYFDNLAFHREELPALTFPPRRKRGVNPFPGQSPGVNTGPGRLPFPTRDQTILPDNLTTKFTTTLREDGKAYVFEYRGTDGRLRYRYEPAARDMGLVTAQWNDRKPFDVLVGGGVRFATDGGSAAPRRIELLDCRRDGETVVTRMRLRLGDRAMQATCTFRLWQKSFVIDVKCLGGQAGEFVIGRAVGSEGPRLVTVPYLVGDAARPAVLVMGAPGEPLFLTALMDHTRSNASKLTFVNRIDRAGVTCNGGSAYLSKTDGRRNDCFERVFLTVSPRFEEVLPSIPNPKSPWMHVAGERLWRAHGASDRKRDYATWAEIARHGMTKVVITDHETGWRDGGESFTFRTRAAPGKGGDAAQADYARKLHALGFRYGIYNNYTDFAPVNEHWHGDMVTRVPDGNWRTAWARCYNPKPLRAVEYEARLAPVIQRKFALSTAYCDVHTAVRPWSYVDHDARVPGAGTFAQTFYCYGEIMLHQKATWNGPVYSEGANHWYYCGLTDGNYAQDRGYDLPNRPWLVDFDLREMHPLCCNFGMGNPGMFYGRDGLGRTPEQRERRLDRFLAATAAFGHTGFLVRAGGMRSAVRSYYLMQALAAAYAQQKVKRIQYADAGGRLLDTSAAVATGAYRRSQVKTTYADGLEVWVNGHSGESWPTPHAKLPPNGYYAVDRTGGLVTWSGADEQGRRFDYVDSPAYVYCDGRGKLRCFAKGACDQAMIALKRDDGRLEVIPVGGPKVVAVSLGGRSATAVALDKDRRPLGPAETRPARGLVHILSRNGAFSYLVTPADKPGREPACERLHVVPGETVRIRCGGKTHACRIAPTARPGQHLWQQADGAWIDFVAVALAETGLSIRGGRARLRLRSNLSGEADFTVELLGRRHAARLPAGEDVHLDLALPKLTENQVLPVELKLSAGDSRMRRTWWLRATRGFRRLAELPTQFEAGQRFRGKDEGPLTTGSIASPRKDMSCGGVRKDGLFMHPPWKGGVGYSYVLYEPIELPGDVPAAFRCRVGKGDGSDPGDGILFRVAVVDEQGRPKPLAEKHWTRHAWGELAADLSPWAGKKVRLKLVADVGRKDNSSGDWACWADLRIESKQSMTDVTVHDKPVRPPANQVRTRSKP